MVDHLQVGDRVGVREFDSSTALTFGVVRSITLEHGSIVYVVEANDGKSMAVLPRDCCPASVVDALAGIAAGARLVRHRRINDQVSVEVESSPGGWRRGVVTGVHRRGTEAGDELWYRVYTGVVSYSRWYLARSVRDAEVEQEGRIQP